MVVPVRVIVPVRMLLEHQGRLFPAAVGQAYVHLRGPHPAAIDRRDLDGDVDEPQASGKRP
jgi:hypothetical protein